MNENMHNILVAQSKHRWLDYIPCYLIFSMLIKDERKGSLRYVLYNNLGSS